MTYFVVPGQPVQWSRAGKKGKRHFTLPPQRAHMDAIALVAAPHFQKPEPGPVHLELHFEIEPPASWSPKKRAAHIGHYVATRPDGSNYQKLVEDALNGVAWIDDDQVVSWSGTKIYAERGQTCVKIERLTC